MSTTEDRADSQARAQVRSIAEMVAALEVDYDRLDELREERAGSSEPSRVLLLREKPGAAINPEGADWWEDAYPEEAEELAQLEAAAGECTNQEEAQQRIQEDALSVEVRSGWGSPGEKMEPYEFRIVLCTGGPHVEIQGDLDQHNEPDSVRILYSDWGTSGELFDFDRDAVLTYCRQFYFGE